MAGRRPKPTAQKIAEGNPGRRAIKSHLSFERAAPSKPSHLTASEQFLWDETCVLLKHVLETVDGAILESYVVNLNRMRRMRALLEEKGETYETHTRNGVMIRQRPEVSIMMQSEKMHKQYCTELGLTPAARVRLPDPSQPDLFQNPWQKIMDGDTARH